MHLIADDALKNRPTDPTGPEARNLALRLESEFVEPNLPRRRELLAESENLSAASITTTRTRGPPIQVGWSRQSRASRWRAMSGGRGQGGDFVRSPRVPVGIHITRTTPWPL
jgi:hypothetical protein